VSSAHEVIAMIINREDKIKKFIFRINNIKSFQYILQMYYNIKLTPKN